MLPIPKIWSGWGWHFKSYDFSRFSHPGFLTVTHIIVLDNWFELIYVVYAFFKITYLFPQCVIYSFITFITITSNDYTHFKMYYPLTSRYFWLIACVAARRLFYQVWCQEWCLGWCPGWWCQACHIDMERDMYIIYYDNVYSIYSHILYIYYI